MYHSNVETLSYHLCVCIVPGFRNESWHGNPRSCHVYLHMIYYKSKQMHIYYARHTCQCQPIVNGAWQWEEELMNTKAKALVFVSSKNKFHTTIHQINSFTTHTTSLALQLDAHTVMTLLFITKPNKTLFWLSIICKIHNQNYKKCLLQTDCIPSSLFAGDILI